ncbi:MAG: branched-chain amino acid ABC transporter substrate-binding protein [Variovorax sp.]|nr:branched-chain amino acid ABC transporter substrate-binding protein [Variovorax sp.]
MKLTSIAATLLALALAPACAAADTMRIAYIDPFTGPAAAINANQSRTIKMIVDIANRERWAGPHQLEIVDFDGRGSVPESLIQFRNAIDQKIHFVMQGLGSNVGLAFVEAANKHNERNPGKEVIYLNIGNTTTEMTNEKCSFWHFRFDSNIDMKMEGLTTLLANDRKIRKVYLINQNYAQGQGVSVAARELLKRKRPDIEIVGDDLHPMLQVKDFSPYVAKIRASGADAVVTSNWSADLSLLLKAVKESSLQVPFYSLHAASTGIPAALRSAGVETVKVATFWHANDDVKASRPLVEEYRKRYGTDDDFVQITAYNTVAMLARAVRESNSTDPVKVARALEGLKMSSLNGEIEMRVGDHQIQQPLYVAEWARSDGKSVVFDVEKTGFGWKPIGKIGAAASSLSTTCQMKRPA